MDLAFPTGLVLIVLLSVLITGQVAGDGRSDWLKGVQLLAVYLVLGLTFFFLPTLRRIDDRALTEGASASEVRLNYSHWKPPVATFGKERLADEPRWTPVLAQP